MNQESTNTPGRSGVSENPMTSGPIIEAAVQAGEAKLNALTEPGTTQYLWALARETVIAALHVAIPKEPTQEWVNEVTNRGRAISPEQAIAVWKRQPIWQELYGKE